MFDFRFIISKTAPNDRASRFKARQDERHPLVRREELAVQLRLVGALQNLAELRAETKAARNQVAPLHKRLRRGGLDRKPVRGGQQPLARLVARVVRRRDAHEGLDAARMYRRTSDGTSRSSRSSRVSRRRNDVAGATPASSCPSERMCPFFRS